MDEMNEKAKQIWEGAEKELGYTGETKKAYINGFIHGTQVILQQSWRMI